MNVVIPAMMLYSSVKGMKNSQSKLLLNKGITLNPHLNFFRVHSVLVASLVISGVTAISIDVLVIITEGSKSD